MEQIGWALIDANGVEVQHWGDTLGVCVGMPDVVRLPSGDFVHCPQPGALQDCKLLPRYAERGIGGVNVQADKVVVSFPVTSDDVRAEAQRRIIALCGARDFSGCLIKQLNAAMRATELVNKRASGGTLTDAETVEAAALQAMADGIKAIRAKSNILEVSMPPDFAADVHWN